jgi:thiosulfate/3-mercaptopyruvate sulfurtransferase
MARTISPIVSTDWLDDDLGNPKVIVIDIRNSEEYQTGHIPGAINIPFTSWITTRNGLSLELPDEIELFDVIGSSGIKIDSRIIIVNKADNPYPLADANRTADTLLYAGISNVAILDGGHDKWVKEGRILSINEVVKPKAAEYRGNIDKETFVSKDYVLGQLGKSIILDARDPNVYFGVTKEQHAARAGHIPGAKCLPAPWVWNADGTYKNINELKNMAAGVAGEPGSREIIVYCGVGGYTSTWWFVLTQLLGYQNVKFYDGSAQDWTRDPEMPMVIYTWE